MFYKKQPEVVSIQNGETSQNVTEQPRPRGQQPDQRRRQIHTADFRDAIGKEVTDLFSSHTAHVRIPGIIEKEIEPKNCTAIFQDPEHFPRDPLFHAGIQNGAKHRGLDKQIERPIGKRNVCCVAAVKRNSIGRKSPCLIDILRQKIKTRDVFRTRTPFDQPAKIAAGAATHFEDLLIGQIIPPVMPEEGQNLSLLFLHHEKTCGIEVRFPFQYLRVLSRWA